MHTVQHINAVPFCAGERRSFKCQYGIAWNLNADFPVTTVFACLEQYRFTVRRGIQPLIVSKYVFQRNLFLIGRKYIIYNKNLFSQSLLRRNGLVIGRHCMVLTKFLLCMKMFMVGEKLNDRKQICALLELVHDWKVLHHVKSAYFAGTRQLTPGRILHRSRCGFRPV